MPILRVATYNIHKGVQGIGPVRRLEIHNIGHAVEHRHGAIEKRPPQFGAQLRVFGIDHHAFKESIDRCAQSSQRLQRGCVVTRIKLRLGLRLHRLHGGVQGDLSRLFEQHFADMGIDGIDLFQEFGGVGLEVVGAAVAAEEDDAVGLAGDAVDVAGGIAHGAEGFAGNQAGLQGIGGAGFFDLGSVGGRRLGVGGEGGGGEAEGENEQAEGGFHR